MSKYMPKRKYSLILDIACGTGAATFAFSQSYKEGKIIGIDSSYGMLNVAKTKAKIKKLKNVQFIRSDASKFPKLTSKKFDAVICNAGFWQIKNKEKVLHNIRLILKHNGKFIFTIPVNSVKGGFDEAGWKKETLKVFEKYKVRIKINKKKAKMPLWKLLKKANFRVVTSKMVKFKSPLKMLIEWNSVPIFTYKGNGILISEKVDPKLAKIVRDQLSRWLYKKYPTSAWRVVVCKPN